MSDPEYQGEEQKCQQEAPDDTEPAPGATSRQRQPGATAAHRLAVPGRHRAVDENFGPCLMASAWQ